MNVLATFTSSLIARIINVTVFASLPIQYLPAWLGDDRCVFSLCVLYISGPPLSESERGKNTRQFLWVE